MRRRALILAAGTGSRLGVDRPKCLLDLGGKSLLRRHLQNLAACGVADVVVGTGYRADLIAAALADCGASAVTCVYNPDYRQGSSVTLWALRQHLPGVDEVLLMDADVLCDQRLIQRVLDSPLPSSLPVDCGLEPDAEAVKLCVRHGRAVELRKQVGEGYDWCGEWVGFARLGAATTSGLLETLRGHVDAGRTDLPYEEVLREVLLADPTQFHLEIVTGLPWIEIDFPADLARARAQILPRLTEP